MGFLNSKSISSSPNRQDFRTFKSKKYQRSGRMLNTICSLPVCHGHKAKRAKGYRRKLEQNGYRCENCRQSVSEDIPTSSQILSENGSRSSKSILGSMRTLAYCSPCRHNCESFGRRKRQSSPTTCFTIAPPQQGLYLMKAEYDQEGEHPRIPLLLAMTILPETPNRTGRFGELVCDDFLGTTTTTAAQKMGGKWLRSRGGSLL